MGSIYKTKDGKTLLRNDESPQNKLFNKKQREIELTEYL